VSEDTLVLCYHAVPTSDWPDTTAVTAKRFATQMAILARRGYRGVTFSEAVSGPPSGRRVAVTFDDGFHSVLDHALPVLERHGWPGTMFVVTDYGDGGRLIDWPSLDRWVGTRYEPELRALSWEELGQLKARGWEIGSHTCSHPRLPKIEPERMRHELAESRRVCIERLGSCESIAYPYGDLNAAVVEAAGVAGYRTAAALPKPLRPPGRELEWPRVGVYHGDWLGRFMLKALPLSRRVRTRAGAG